MIKNIINWCKLPIVYVLPDKWNENVDYVMDNELKRYDGPFPARQYTKFIGYYSLEEYKTTLELEFIKNGVPVRMRCDKGNSGNADSDITGFQCYNEVQSIWQRENNTSSTLFKTYSGRKYKELYKQIKHNVPLQISYINPMEVGRKIRRSNCYKADVSSAFPYQATKILPTLKDSMVITGYAEPNEEFPFAFYLHSHHIRIYNELDTHTLNSPLYQAYPDIYDDTVKPEDEVTVLCKSEEKYTLKSTFEYLYAHRKESSNNKLYMNATIGFFHKNTNPTLSPVAAVIIARNNARMINYANELINEGNYILYIATDCIVWQGEESNIATNTKSLGNFTYEGKRGNFFGWMVGSYQYIDEDGNLTTKSSYIPDGMEKNSLKFGELPPPKHSEYWLDTNGKIIEIEKR